MVSTVDFCRRWWCRCIIIAPKIRRPHDIAVMVPVSSDDRRGPGLSLEPLVASIGRVFAPDGAGGRHGYFLCRKKKRRIGSGAKLLWSHCARSTISLVTAELHGSSKQGYLQARAELNFEPLLAIWARVQERQWKRTWSSSKNGRIYATIPGILLMIDPSEDVLIF